MLCKGGYNTVRNLAAFLSSVTNWGKWKGRIQACACISITVPQLEPQLQMPILSILTEYVLMKNIINYEYLYAGSLF